MKKLMIAAAVACAAAMSQAAAITWSSGALKDAGGTIIEGATAKLYTISSTQYDTWLQAITDNQASGMKTVYDALNATTPTIDPVQSSNKGIAALVDPTDISTASKTDPVALYAAVIYSYSDGDGNDWYIANVGTFEATANTAKTVNNMGLKVGGGTAGAAILWQAAPVPEPTSGLLLLLGLASLALRRRRA